MSRTETVNNTYIHLHENFDAMTMAYFRAGGVIHRLEKNRAQERIVCLHLIEQDTWEFPRLVEGAFVPIPASREAAKRAEAKASREAIAKQHRATL